MNYIKHLTGFFNRIAMEKSLNPTHISLYLIIFQYWNVNRFKNPITVTRYEMMKGSKISSNATYHKCIRELQRLGYLEYIPSFNPNSGTLITVNDFSDVSKPKYFEKEVTRPKNESTMPKNESTRPKNEPTSSKNEQVNGQATEQDDGQLYIYNKKTIKNIENLYIEPEIQILNDDHFLENQKKENEKEMLFAFADTEKKQTEESRQKSSAKKEKRKLAFPTMKLVKEYFKFQEYSEFEAERFFNYYSSNGWLIGGKTKMKDWKASARNWMLNTSKFTVNIPQNNNIPQIHSSREQPRAQNLHTLIDKNYAEPL